MVVPPKEEPPVADSFQLEGTELAVYRDVLSRLGAKYPALRTSPDDDDRRKLTKMIVQTLKKKLGKQWGWKSQHANLAAPSKDAAARTLGAVPTHGAEAEFVVFDTVNGTTREMNLGGHGEMVEQYWIEVEAIDWLDDEADIPDTPEPPPPVVVPPVEEPPVNEAVLAAILTELVAVKEELSTSRLQVAEVRAALQRLEARVPPMGVVFPNYEGKFFGRSVTLVPKP